MKDGLNVLYLVFKICVIFSIWYIVHPLIPRLDILDTDFQILNIGSMEYIIWICLFLHPCGTVLFFSVALDNLEWAVCFKISSIITTELCLPLHTVAICNGMSYSDTYVTGHPLPPYNYELKLLPHLITDIQNNTVSQKNEIQSEKTTRDFIVLYMWGPHQCLWFCITCLSNWSALKCAVWFDDCEQW